jgi:DNA-binding GntR family transcriptional regulator
MNLSLNKKAFIPIYPVSLVEQIVEFLTQAAIEGRIREGARLSENELQKIMGVSRSPIREAFRVLEKKGLVTIIPRRGTFVQRINEKSIEENFTIRAWLESLAARLATGRLNQEEIRNMTSSLSKMTQAARKRNFTHYLKHHAEFHNTFISACGNDTLIKISENLRIRVIWHRFMFNYVRENLEYGLQVHGEILHLFKKKDAVQVESLVKEHILVALNWFLEFLESKEKEEFNHRGLQKLDSSNLKRKLPKVRGGVNAGKTAIGNL